MNADAMLPPREVEETPVLRPFDPQDLEPKGLLEKVEARLAENPLWWLGLLRWLKPAAVCPGWVPRYGPWALITRYDDVQEALRQDKTFTVLFGERTIEINDGPNPVNGGTNFMLTMDDGEGYQTYRRQIMQAFTREDVSKIVAPLSADCARQIVAESRGRLDAVKDLITRVPIEICRKYYGIDIPNGDEFAEWSFAISPYAWAGMNL